MMDPLARWSKAGTDKVHKTRDISSDVMTGLRRDLCIRWDARREVVRLVSVYRLKSLFIWD